MTRERLSSLEEKEVLAAGAASVGGFQPLADPPGRPSRMSRQSSNTHVRIRTWRSVAGRRCQGLNSRRGIHADAAASCDQRGRQKAVIAAIVGA